MFKENIFLNKHVQKLQAMAFFRVVSKYFLQNINVCGKQKLKSRCFINVQKVI